MKNKKLLLGVALFFCAVFLIGSISASMWCYQANVNVPNETGKDGNCGLQYNGLYKGLWNGTVSFWIINYTKPIGAKPTSLWTIGLGVLGQAGQWIIQNVSIPLDCWNYDTNKLELAFVDYYNYATNSQYNYGACYNGTIFKNVTLIQQGAYADEYGSAWDDTSIKWADFNTTSQYFSSNWRLGSAPQWNNGNGQLFGEAMTWDVPVQLDSCQELNVEGESYILNQNVSATGYCFTITAPNITLDCNGYSITGDGTGTAFTENSGYNTVKNCVIDNFGEGIAFGNDVNWIINNTLTNIVDIGINTEDGNDFTITGNYVEAGNYGITMGSSIATDNVVFADIGIFESNGVGILTGNNVTGITTGIFLRYHSDNILTGNTVTGDIGIYIFNSNNNNITGNNVTGGGYGVLIESSNNNLLTGNNATGGWGIELSGSSYNNLTRNIGTGGNEGISMITGSNYNIFNENTVEGGEGGFYLEDTVGNFFFNNTATGGLTGGAGMMLLSSTNTTILNNRFIGGSGTADGIYIEYSTNNFLTNNIATGVLNFIRVNMANYNIITDDITNCMGIANGGVGNIFYCGNVHLTSDYTYKQVDAGILDVITGNVAGFRGATSFFPTFIVLGSLVVLIVLTIIIINSVKASGMIQEGA